MSEEWRPVVGWEDAYEVSDHGQVRSLPRVTIRRNGRPIPVPGCVRALCSNEDGYQLVTLAAPTRTVRVHILVLEAFVGPCPEGQESRHLDGDPANNHWPSNLCWGTHSENTYDKIRHGTHAWAGSHAPRGPRRPRTVTA